MHEKLVKDTENGEFKVEASKFWKLLNQCRRKNKRSYDWLVKAGRQYQEAVFELVKKILDDEKLL